MATKTGTSKAKPKPKPMKNAEAKSLTDFEDLELGEEESKPKAKPTRKKRPAKEKPKVKSRDVGAIKKKYRTPTKVWKGNPTPKLFTWRPLKRKNVWDGSWGIHSSRDPLAEFKGFPNGYLTDPATKVVVMKRVKSMDRFCDKEEDGTRLEVMWKADRRKYMKSKDGAAAIEKIEEANDVVIPPVEYYGVIGDRGFVIATSFGADRSALDPVG